MKSLIAVIYLTLSLVNYIWDGAAFTTMYGQQEEQRCQSGKNSDKLPNVCVPEEFKGTQENKILFDSGLNPVFEKIYEEQEVRLMVLGDSHINGHFLPAQLEEYLGSYFNQRGSILTMKHYGIDGAWAKRFIRRDILDMVEEFDPDFVILAFGTNEAHNTTVDPAYIERTFRRLVDSIQVHSNTKCTFLLTTPPGSHVRKVVSEEQQLYEYQPNLNNAYVADAISQFGEKNNIAVWDLFNIIGGSSYFSRNWKGHGYMQPDNVHYKRNGYELQGGLLATAIIESYDNYVSIMHPEIPDPVPQAGYFTAGKRPGLMFRMSLWFECNWERMARR